MTGPLPNARRGALNMSQGFVLWFTGLSGAGKSTLAALVSERLRAEGVHVECLDGDDVRKHLSWGLGFSREDRDRNVRRIGYVARMVARAGACAVTAAISPYKSVRTEVREQSERFVEVYCECPIAVLSERDPKGLYKRALAGEIKHFTGVDDPYEPPEAPEVHLHTDRQSAAECVDIIIERLVDLGYVRGRSATSGVRLPAPYGGELFDAPVRPLEEGAPLARRVEVTETEAAQTSLVAAGYFSPVSGFMTRRELEEVHKNRHLERGLAWTVPVVCEVAGGASAPTVGEEVGLVSAGRELGRLHVQQVTELDDRARLAGVVESITPGFAISRSARDLRTEFGRRGLSHVVAWFEERPITSEVAAEVAAAYSFTDGVVLFVPAERRDLALAHFGEDENVLVCALPLAVYYEALRAPQIVAQNVGARRAVVSGRAARIPG